METEKLLSAFPYLQFAKNVILAPFTFMKVGGPAKLYVEVEHTDDLFALSSFCCTNNIEFTVLGGVSNTVIADEGLDRLVIRNLTNGVQVEEEGKKELEKFQIPNHKFQNESEKVSLTVDSGVVTAKFANFTMQLGLTGLEHFVGVPGTIGGAVFNNSHFTAHELIGNFITQVDVCTQEGKRETWTKEMLKFGYDYSVFHEVKAVILSATFELYKGDQVHIQEKMLEAAKKRAATQPIGTPSTGCMWRNPKVSSSQLSALSSQFEIPATAIKEIDGQKQIAAGFLIDKAGLKGMSVGGAQVSEKHATYIVNTGNATTEEIDILAKKVEGEVLQKFGIALEREVFFVQ